MTAEQDVDRLSRPKLGPQSHWVTLKCDASARHGFTFADAVAVGVLLPAEAKPETTPSLTRSELKDVERVFMEADPAGGLGALDATQVNKSKMSTFSNIQIFGFFWKVGAAAKTF